MRRAALVLPTLLGLACERTPQAAAETRAEPATRQPAEHAPPEPERLADEPVDEGLPPIPGLLLDRLAIEREGSFALPEGSDELAPRAAVALGGGLALVGEARSHADPGTWRWVGFAADTGRGKQSTRADAELGTIRAAISDGEGGALLAGRVGDGGDARGWFGVLDARGAVVRELELDLDSEAPIQPVDLLAGHGPDERAVVLGETGGRGWVVSLDSRGAVRWRSDASSFEAARIHAAARLDDERGGVLAIGARGRAAGELEPWWGTIVGYTGAEVDIEQAGLELEGADPQGSLDAIVDLGTSFVALGRARRERVQDHDQVIAVGFDRSGQPTWSRVLDHFRAIEIYGGAVNPELPGIANFVVRVPITGGEDQSALAWLDISPGVDGILVPRQLAGTVGWASAGFIEGREMPAILAYTHTEAGIDWRVLPLETSYRVGAPK